MRPAKQTITAEGKAEVEAELKYRTEVQRAEIRAAIKVAREFGDLKENAEYHAAREEQGMNEARIRALEHHLANAEVGTSAGAGTVGVGSRVSYRDAAAGQVREVTLAHPLEADIATAKLSATSPIGRALIGRSAGDQVEVTTPRGAKQLEILSVS